MMPTVHCLFDKLRTMFSFKLIRKNNRLIVTSEFLWKCIYKFMFALVFCLQEKIYIVYSKQNLKQTCKICDNLLHVRSR